MATDCSYQATDKRTKTGDKGGHSLDWNFLCPDWNFLCGRSKEDATLSTPSAADRYAAQLLDYPLSMILLNKF